MIKISPFKLNVLLLIITIIAQLVISAKPYVWESYSDVYDYLKQSKISIFSIDFFAPKPSLNFYPRPFTIPLIYKLSGSSPDIIIIIQKIIHSLCTFLLAYSLLLFLQKKINQYIVVFLIYYLMSWWNILGWTELLLSESLSISFMFLWIATFLISIKKNTLLTFILHITTTILFSFTRDNWPYVIVLFYLLCVCFFYFHKKIYLNKILFLTLFGITLFYIQGITSNIGQRYKLPILNSIILRIIPNEKYTQWFVENGLPQSDSLRKFFSGINPNDESKIKLYGLYKDSTYNSLFNWIVKDGKITYLKFLITHPSYSLLFEESDKQIQRIWSYNLFYTPSFKGYSRLAQFVFPIFHPLITLLLLIIVLFKYRVFFTLITICLFIAFSFNILLLYNADAMEVERHLFITNIINQIIAFFCIFIIVENFTLIKKVIKL